jgi:uncharacterized membrane protein SirB2
VKFTLYFQILSERLGDASFLPIFGIGLATVLVIAFLTCRWGAGFLMAFPYVLIALVMSSNEEVSGVGLLSQYAFAGIMVVYALFARSTSFRWSPVNGALLVLAGFMVLNSTRSTDLQGFGLSAVYVLFFVGLIVGGQKALGTERGRRVYAKSTMFFLAVIMLMQIPDLARGRALMEGTFSSRVGIMLLGVGAAIMSFWWALRRRLFSRTFFACIPIGVLSIFCMLLTAGRTALGTGALGPSRRSQLDHRVDGWRAGCGADRERSGLLHRFRSGHAEVPLGKPEWTRRAVGKRPARHHEQSGRRHGNRARQRQGRHHGRDGGP